MTTPLTPTWLAPSVPGQMSNKRGSNTGADALTFKVRYARGAGGGFGDNAGTVRVVVRRTGNVNGAQPSQVMWDSGWVGTPTSGPILDATSVTRGPGGSAIYNGRVYVVADLAATSTARFVESAAIQAGGSVGPFRSEGNIPFSSPAGVGEVVVSMCQVAGRLYVLTYSLAIGPTIFYASINSSGSLGAWTQSTVKPAQPGQIVGGQMGSGFSPANQGFLIVVGSGGGAAASTTVQNCGLNPDGSLQGFVNTTALPAARYNGAVYLDTVTGFLVYVGGVDATPTVQATIYTASVALTGTGSPGAIGAWSTQTHALPVALNLAAIVVTNMDATPYMFVLGGTTTTAAAGAVATVYAATLSNTVGVGQVGVWSAALAPAMPTALCQEVAFLTPQAGASNESYIVTTGGLTTAGAKNMTTSEIQQTGAGALTGAWISGVPAGLVVGNLGTGAALTTNQDGSQDWTFNFGAFGVAVLNALADGDILQLAIQFTDVNGADPSPQANTLFVIGQPPALSALLPGAAITTGRVTASLNYTPGAGGSGQASWRITVKIGATVYFDSGIRYDQSNSVLVNLAPLLLTATAYTFAWTVTSTDSVFNGASNTTTSTLAVTPTITAPAAPTGLTATLDNPNGAVKLAWVNPTPPATPGNRVYYRRTRPSNGGFEVATAGDATLPDQWGRDNAGTGTSVIDAANAHSGTNAAALSQGTVNFGRLYQKTGILVSPGQVLPLSLWMKGSIAGGTLTARVTFVNPGSAVSRDGIASARPSTQAGAQNVDTAFVPAATYALFTANVTVPANCQYAFVELWANGTPGAVTIYVDDVSVSAWNVLVDSVGALAAYTAMDQIALSTAYDFAVSQLDLSATTAESPLSLIAAGVSLDATAYGCFLHVAGNGIAYGVALNMRGQPTFQNHLDVTAIEGFGLAPSLRYGPGDWHDINFEAFIPSLAMLRQFQSVIGQAQAGATLYYRDGFGAMFTCGLDTSVGVTYKAPLYRYAPMKFKQVPNLYSPSLAQGSAAGIPSQLNGSVPPLDPSENPV